MGFGVGALLIVCSWGARAVLGDAPDEERTTTNRDESREVASLPPLERSGGDHNGDRATTPSARTEAAGDDAAGRLATRTGPKGLVDGATSPVDVLVSLGVVIAVMVGVLFGVSRLMRRARLAPGRNKELELVDALSLGGKRQVYVVSYKDRTLVLGCGQEDISLLAEYAADEFSGEGEPAMPDEIGRTTDDLSAADAGHDHASRDAAAASTRDEAADEPDPVHVRAGSGVRRPRSTVTTRTDGKTQDQADDTGGVVLKLSAAARKQAATPAVDPDVRAPESPVKDRPAGAHRVPAAFRHLLDKSIAEAEERR